MAFRATYASPSCPRCLKPIAEGDLITAYYPVAGGPRRWAHRGCQLNRNGAPPDDAKRKADYAEQERAQEEAAYRAKMERDQALRDAPRPEAPRVELPAKAPADVQIAPAKDDAQARLRAQLTGLIETAVQKVMGPHVDAVNGQLQALADSVQASVVDSLKGLAEAAVQAQLDRLPLLKTVVVKDEGGRELARLDGQLVHPAFDKALLLVRNRKPVLAIGPTGCGKTHLAEQVAAAAGLRYGIVSCSAGLTEAKLFGRVRGDNLEFRAAPFLEIFEHGGLFCFDELDGMDPNAALAFNSALANSVVGVPDRTTLPPGVESLEAYYELTRTAEGRERCRGYGPLAFRHKDFVAFGTANTWGRGADRQYVGRYQLDEATLDRFRVGTLEVDYCEAVERGLCPDEGLYALLAGWRAKLAECRVHRPISTRFIRDAYEMVRAGFTLKDVERAALGGLRRDEVVKVLGRELAAA